MPVEDILRFEREYLDYLANNTEALTTLRETNVLDDETVRALEKSIADFKLVFRLSLIHISMCLRDRGVVGEQLSDDAKASAMVARFLADLEASETAAKQWAVRHAKRWR